MRWSFDDYEVIFAEDRDSAIAACIDEEELSRIREK
jgi:hypothetical protein